MPARKPSRIRFEGQGVSIKIEGKITDSVGVWRKLRLSPFLGVYVNHFMVFRGFGQGGVGVGETGEGKVSEERSSAPSLQWTSNNHLYGFYKENTLFMYSLPKHYFYLFIMLILYYTV